MTAACSMVSFGSCPRCDRLRGTAQAALSLFGHSHNIAGVAMDGNSNREERVRHRAYRIWQQEGRPEGRDIDHWEQAEQEIEREDKLAQEDERGSDHPAVGPVPGV